MLAKQPARDEKRMPHREVPAFIARLRASEADAAVKDALEWLILTVTRTIETLGATRNEVDAKAALWTIPRERVASAEHAQVPLSKRARAILAARTKRPTKSDLLFADETGKPPTSAGLLVAMRRLGTKAVPHGFRYSFNAWAKANAKPGADRRAVLEAWSRFCTRTDTAR